MVVSLPAQTGTHSSTPVGAPPHLHFIHVHLEEDDVLKLGAQLLKDWADHSAGPAPGGLQRHFGGL